MYHISFICSSVNGHLGFFHVLTTVNSAMNTGVQVSFGLWFSPDICPGVGLLNSIFSLRNFHTVLHHGCTNLHFCQQKRGIPFSSTPSPAFVACSHFGNSRSDWCKVISHYSFNLHFSNN